VDVTVRIEHLLGRHGRATGSGPRPGSPGSSAPSEVQ
jgi:hypothetical protein